MEIIGIIKEIREIEQLSETFVRRAFILDSSIYDQGSGKKWENYNKFQLIGRNVDIINHFTTGQRVKITFNINGRFVKSKDGTDFFAQNLNAYKIEQL